jgi:hypothetical protein
MPATTLNSMDIEDVRKDTQVIHRTFCVRGNGDRGMDVRVQVIALKPCGCEGPYLGHLEQVRYADYPDEFIGVPRRGAKLWSIHPTTKNAYTDRKNAVAYALGKTKAANQLRDWMADRYGGNR